MPDSSNKMPDIVNYSFITRKKLADEIQSRAIAANKISITQIKKQRMVSIELIFGNNVDIIIYIIDVLFYNNFLKSTFEK